MHQQYVERGLSVIPLVKGDKIPHFNLLKSVGWVIDDIPVWRPATQAVAEPTVLEALFRAPCNIGLVCGKVSGDLAVLDFDEPDTYRAWAMKNRKFVTSTPVVRTGSGYHVYIKIPDAGCANLYMGGKFMGHFKSENSYVVAPPSVHKTGVVYESLRS